ATVIAAFSFALASGLMVSIASAAPNSGGTTKTEDSRCQGLYNDFVVNNKSAVQAYSNGYVEAAVMFFNQADDDKAYAQSLGCSWAARIAPPTNHITVTSRPVAAIG